MANASPRQIFCWCSISMFSLFLGCSGRIQHAGDSNLESVDQNSYIDKNHLSTFSKHHSTIDSAYLSIALDSKGSIDIYLQYDICNECSMLHVASLKGPENVTLNVATQFAARFVVSQAHESINSSQILCSGHYHFEEDGEYLMVLDDTSMNSCIPIQMKPPIKSQLPIYIAYAVLATGLVLWLAISFVYRTFIYPRLFANAENEQLLDNDLGLPTNTAGVEDNAAQPIRRNSRLRSLDTFRGLSLVVMIFVNYGGGNYWFFKHSTWDGLTVADLVFPWFTFIMGTSIALAFKTQLRKGKTRMDLAKKVIKRSLMLFAIGLIITNRGRKGLINPSQIRIPGVLQRLAFTYFIVAFMEVFFASSEDRYRERKWAAIRDIVPFWPEWLITMGIVTLHLCLTFLMPIPGCPRGYLGPGGLHENGTYSNCTGGAAAVIDKQIFGVDHIYQHPTCVNWYQCKVPHDPEGILGTLTSILICFLGLHAGKILIYFENWKGRAVRWLIWAAITGIIAGVLCDFQQFGGVIPVNKNLWSLSFVLALTSMAYILLLVLYLTIDVLSIWNGAPFFYPGMNSIIIYVGHEIFHYCFPIQFKVPETHATLLAMNIYGAALWTICAFILYCKQIFIAI